MTSLAALILGLSKFAVQRPPYQFLLQINERKADDAKERHHQARGNKVHDIHDQHQADGGDETAFEERPENFSPRAQGRVAVKTLGFENQRRRRNQGEIKPDHVVKDFERMRLKVQPRDDMRVGAQHVGQPEADGKQTGIGQLVDLRSNLTVASQHGFTTLFQ